MNTSHRRSFGNSHKQTTGGGSGKRSQHLNNTSNNNSNSSSAVQNNATAFASQISISTTASSKLNWYFEFCEIELAREFLELNQERGLTYFFCLLFFASLFFILPSSLFELVKFSNNKDTSSSHMSVMFAMIKFLLSLMLIISGSYIFFIHSSSDGGGLMKQFYHYFTSSSCRVCFPFWSSMSQMFSSASNTNNNQNRKNNRLVHSETTLSAQRIEISVFREFSGRSGGGTIHSSNIASGGNSRRVAPTPRFFAMAPNGDAPSIHSIRNAHNSNRYPATPGVTTNLTLSSLSNKGGSAKSQAALSVTSGVLGQQAGNDEKNSMTNRLMRCKIIFLILYELLFMISFCQRSLMETCTSTVGHHHHHPRIQGFLFPSNTATACDLSGYFVMYHAFFLLAFPYFVFVALPEVPIGTVWMSMLSAIIVITVVIWILAEHNAWAVILIYIMIVISLTIDMQLHKVQMFLTTRKLGGIVEENEQSAVRTHAQEMRHMIANVAHDLKTPLASFLTGLEFIQMVMDESKQGQITSTSIGPCVNNMRNTHAFMLMTINRCIDYTKASKGLKLIPKHETINLTETLELPLNCMKNMQQKIDIVLQSIPTEVCSFVITDKQWLQENVLCLLSNAVKYSAEGIVTINVSLEEYLAEGWKMCAADNISRDDGSRCSASDAEETSKRSHVSHVSHVSATGSVMFTPFIRIEVEDTGIGMSEEAMTSLFNPFKQTQRLAGGTGLGLYSLAKRLEALHGFYGVMKRRDGKQGSLFWFAIPYKPDMVYALHHKQDEKEDSSINGSVKKSNSEGARLAEALLATDSSNGSTKNIASASHEVVSIEQPQSDLTTNKVLKILLVDDSPTIVKMSSLMLKKLGHDIQTAENGAIAVKMVQETLNTEKFFDVILMDLQMPVMDGLEATRRIRAMEKEEEHLKKHIVIGMSANSDHETSVNAYDVGVDAFLPKPFKVETFRSTLGRLL